LEIASKVVVWSTNAKEAKRPTELSENTRVICELVESGFEHVKGDACRHLYPIKLDLLSR
jgi:hypothetical protein